MIMDRFYIGRETIEPTTREKHLMGGLAVSPTTANLFPGSRIGGNGVDVFDAICNAVFFILALVLLQT